MKNEEMDTLINNMREKLGDEQAGIIGDDLATILSDNVAMNSSLEQKDTQITNLQKDKENLITANGNLFQKISMGLEPNTETPATQTQREIFSYRDAFDDKGNFI